MALKDWKKVVFDDGSFKYVNKKKKGILHIWGKNVQVSIGVVKMQGQELTETSIYEEFDTHSQAIAYAKKYMREN